MSEDNTPTTPEAPAAAPEAAPQETFSRDYVEKLRDEAASHRTKAKTAADEARAEVIKEYEGKLATKDTEFSELRASHAEAALELLKLKKVLEAEVPTADILEVAALVQGSDDETVSASVQRVKALLSKAPAHVPATDSTQGSGNGHMPLNGDAVVNALARAVGAPLR